MKKEAVEFVGKTNVLVRVPEKANGDGRYTSNHTFIDRTILVTSLKNVNTSLYLTYKAKGQTQGIYIRKDLVFETLTKAEQKTAMQEMKKGMLENLGNTLVHNFSIGSDPEIFVEDEEKNIIPAFDFLHSKKQDSHVYWDGYQAEFITEAGTCLDGQSDSIFRGLKRVLTLARDFHKKARLSARTAVEISSKSLREAKEEHVQFGCMPSKNAYDMKGLEANGREFPIRSAGGHIHFGIGKKTKAEYERIVKALDAIIGVACVSMFEKFDDPRRRDMYGLAGEYRTPPHGLEYRTLSNAWLFHPIITNVVIDVARKALMLGQLDLLEFWNAKEDETIKVINTCDVKGARKILERNKELFTKIIAAAYRMNTPVENDIIFNMFFRGMHEYLETPEDIEKNWNLKGNDRYDRVAMAYNWSSGKTKLVNKRKV